jgi:hypothetical protein
MKVCKICGIEKSLGEFKKDCNICKKCHYQKYKKPYDLRNKEKISTYTREYYQARDKKQVSDYNKRYYNQNREKILKKRQEAKNGNTNSTSKS